MSGSGKHDFFALKNRVLPHGKMILLAHRTIISSKGQVVVPAELREQLGLKKGTAATWTEENGRLVLTPISAKLLDEIRGSLKPGPGESSAFEGCFEERVRERARDK